MTLKNINADGIVNMYVSGHSGGEVSEKLGVSKAFVYKTLKAHNVKIRPRLHVQLADQIITPYTSGESENSIAKRLGVSRKVVFDALMNAGISRRTQSEAETVKWSFMDADKRAAQVAAAHSASKKLPRSKRVEILEKCARMKEQTGSKIGHLESEFFEAFKMRGFDVAQQVATGIYNLDLSIWNTAIEIHANTAHPHSHPFYLRRIMYLLERGMDVVYIKCIGKIDIDRAADQVGKLVNFSKRNKSTIRHYWMVRGSGELVACRGFDGNELATVNALDAFLD